MQLDIVTCYAGVPRGFVESQGRLFRVADYNTGSARARFLKTAAASGYTAAGIICSGEPIMTKWKWALLARVPAKFFILNENGDYFWLDWSQWRTIRHFILYRTGLAGAGAVRTLARLALFPITLAYLLLYAATIHLRRKLRS